MKKNILLVTLSCLVVLIMVGLANAQGLLVYETSFEEDTIGVTPAGWQSAPFATSAVVVDSSEIPAADGQKVVRLTNDPSSYGEFFLDTEDIYHGKLVVQFYQISSPRENINIEIRNQRSRLAGAYITQSGNVRARDNGVTTGNLINLPVENWHIFVMEWNVAEQWFKISYVENGQENLITQAQLDATQSGEPGNRIYINISPRDEEKVAYIDNVRIYDLGK